MKNEIKNNNLLSYLDYTRQPWGELFYKIIWKQLPIIENKNVLDFGSGFGITANHLSERNYVSAIEPSEDMLTLGTYNNNINVIKGDVHKLRQLPSNCFDAIICHNVLEYTDKKEELFEEFLRVLKDDGFISIVKHNKMGRIMQKAVFDYEIDSVKKLLNNTNLNSSKFGVIRIYDNNSIADYSKGKLMIEKCYGVCTFYGLQRNDIKFEKEWLPEMLDLELKVSQIDELRNIAFFHHLILRKNKGNDYER